jgi:hypothetical protein
MVGRGGNRPALSRQENATMPIATASDFERAPARPLVAPLLVAIACVALADWLFYGWEIGISLALFLGVLGADAVASNGVHAAARGAPIVMSAAFVAGRLLQPNVAGFRFDRDIRYANRRSAENWRAWGFREWRLEQYLSNNPDTPPNPSDSGKG